VNVGSIAAGAGRRSAPAAPIRRLRAAPLSCGTVRASLATRFCLMIPRRQVHIPTLATSLRPEAGTRLEMSMRVLPAIVACCLIAVASAATPEDEFVAAWNEGQHNERSTVDGALYVRGMVRWLGPALADSVRQCKGRAKDMTRPVRLAVQLNLDGSVRRAMVSPSDPHWECVKDALAKKTFPAPPRDGFWTSGTIH
jgi:hypothetical protein